MTFKVEKSFGRQKTMIFAEVWSLLAKSGTYCPLKCGKHSREVLPRINLELKGAL